MTKRSRGRNGFVPVRSYGIRLIRRRKPQAAVEAPPLALGVSKPRNLYLGVALGAVLAYGGSLAPRPAMADNECGPPGASINCAAATYANGITYSRNGGP